MMKQIYYVIQTIVHSRGANAIKIISLGLGLMMSILLFSRVAYEQSFDTCFKEHENLYQLWTVFTLNGEEKEPQEMNLGPMAGAILERFPNEVEQAVTLRFDIYGPITYGNSKYISNNNVVADSLFFETMGVEVLKGNPIKDFQQQDIIYLSESLAKHLFADEDPIGKKVNLNKQFDMIVKGIYKDIPDNSTIHPVTVISMPSLWNRGLYYSWNGGDSWQAYLRLKPDVDVETLNKQIDKAIKEHVPDNDKISITCMLKPIRDTYRGYEKVRNVTQILLIMALSILFITALNYVLISISSLSRRAKAVGVHKCNGADAGNILGMFLSETAIIILLSLILTAFLVLNFQNFVEDTASTQLSNLFAWERIWVSASVVVLLFLIGGLLPGIVFANIPVTQVFKRHTEGKKSWKQSLLFIQFAGVTFIVGIMFLIMAQYHNVINKDVGYNPVRMAMGNHSLRNLNDYEANYNFYHSLPYVDAITCTHANPIEGYSGEFVKNESGENMFSTRYDYATANYPELMGMTIKQGRSPKQNEEVAVNETFVEKMRWGNEAIGKQLSIGRRNYKVVGVIKDFTIQNHLLPTMPFMLYYNSDKMGYCVQLRLKEPFAENLIRLNKDVAEAFPHKHVEFKSMEKEIMIQYNDIRILRNATIVATFVIFFITLMGLIGYTNDETNRRSKEIAIRKVNGAEAWGIIELLAKDVLWTALPAVLIGTFAAWYVGELWMSQFATTIENTIPYYIMTAILTLAMIVGIVITKTWKIANENPVKSIKSE